MKVDFDFVIIGSGVLGCLAYDYLSSRNNNILLVSEDKIANKDKNVIQSGSQIYSGISSGRKNGLGGTSQIWGGAMNKNFEKQFIQKCETDNIYFDVEKDKVFDFFGMHKTTTKPKKQVYRSKKYTFYEEEIVWPNFRKRNVFKNLKNKYKNSFNLKIGSYQKVVKIGKIFKVFIQSGSGRIDVISCKKVVFCMGFIENIREMLKNNENFIFKEHISSPIGVINNTENFPLCSSLSYKFNHFETKRYEIFDNIKNKSIGFIHLSNKKSDFLIKLRDLLICIQSFKIPSIKSIYEVIKLSYQFFPVMKGMLINNGDISNRKSESYIHLVIDKEISNEITKKNDELHVKWDISDIEIETFKTLKLEINKIINNLIYQPQSPKKLYKSFKNASPKEIFHPFSGCSKQNIGNSDYIWVGTHALNELGSLSPTLAAHFLKMKEYENARKNMRNYTDKK